MKEKSTSRSAFFSIRLLGVLILLAGILLALASSGVFSVAAQNVIQAMTKNRIITYSMDPLGTGRIRLFENLRHGHRQRGKLSGRGHHGGLRRDTR